MGVSRDDGDRVLVFVDYQNVYRAARRSFGPAAERADFTFGQVHPLNLGELLVARRLPNRHSRLVGVRVFRGMPDGSRDPKCYGACRSQVSAWKRLGSVGVTNRPLRYPPDYPAGKPQEKGIDVELALDIALGAIKDRYDVAVLFSLDTDLRPALEATIREGRHVEVAAWAPEDQPVRRLHIPSTQVWCHQFARADYGRVRDRTDYTLRP